MDQIFNESSEQRHLKVIAKVLLIKVTENRHVFSKEIS